MRLALAFFVVALTTGLAASSITVTPATVTLSAGQSQQFTANLQGANTKGLTWSVNGVPGGNSSIGIVSGNGMYTAPSTFTVQTAVTVTANATSVAKSVGATVTIVPATKVTISPATATVAPSQSQQFTATVTGTTNTAVAWSVAAGVGTISTTGLYTAPSSIISSQSVTIKATSAADSTKSAAATITLVPPVGVTVTPTSVSLGQSQTQQFTAYVTGTNNTAVTWTLSPSVGTISTSGLYTAPASITSSQSIAITATSAADVSKRASATVTLKSPALSITTTSLPNGTTGRPYSAIVAGSGGTPPYTWSMLSGQLPPGIVLSLTNGSLFGTPTTGGSYTMTVQITDAAGNLATAALSLVVSLGLTLTSATLPNGVSGAPYNAALTAAGGTPPYVWTLISGSLPPGITQTSTGALSGTPTATGAYTFTEQVSDAAGTVVTGLATMSISAPSKLNISNADLPNGIVGTAYTATLTATGGNPPYTWAIPTGNLPAGLTLNSSTGLISGVPTTAGWSNFFSVRANDATGAAAILSYSFTIKPVTDPYGGFLSQPCTATGTFHTQKINNRWWFCTPAGNVYWNLSVGAVGGQDGSGADSSTGLSFNLAATNIAKYGDITYNWAIAQNKRLNLWGFNGIGQDSSAYVKPMAAGFSVGDGTQPVKLPMTDTLEVSSYAGVNLWGYGTRPLKNLAQGYSNGSRVWVGHGKSIMDYVDPAFQGYVSTFLANDTAAQSYKTSPYVLGLFLDDTDWSWGFGAGPDFPTQPSLAHNNSAPAYEVIVTSPVQRFQPNPAYSNFGVMYADGRVFSKVAMSSPPATCSTTSPCSLRDYLYKKYSGSIAGLNSAWGSHYTTFDSSGTSYTAVQVGVGNGSATTFNLSLPNAPVSPYSMAVYVNGIQVGGDCPYYNASCNSVANVGSFMSPQGTWSAGQIYAQTYIVDSNGNLEQAQNTGNNGSIQPVWNRTQGGTTIAGNVTWKNLGPSIKSGASGPWAQDGQVTNADCGACGLPQASYWFQTTWHGMLSAPSRQIGATFSSGAPQITITTQNSANDAPPGATSIDIYVSCRVLNGPAVNGCAASTDPQPAPTLQVSGVPYPLGSWTEPTTGLVGGASLPAPPSSMTYVAGTGSINFNTAPANGAAITVDYIANGWPYGTGLMDEDGRNTWLGTNDVCLTPHTLVCGPGLSFPAPNANATAGADLEAWNAQFAASYFSQSKAAMAQQLPGIMYFGTDTLGTWGAPPPLGVLQGAAPYVDGMFTTIYPGQSYSDSIYQFITQYLGDKPMMNFLTEQSTPDSFLWPYGAQSGQVIAATTQVQRGQNWYTTINSMLNAVSYNGTYQWVGANWWGLYDFWSEKTNWGLVSLDDNPYDGKSSCQQKRTDPWGYSTGGETPSNGGTCFGSAIDYVKQANSLPYTMTGK